MMHPANERQPIPMVLTGPGESADSCAIDDFVKATLGKPPPASTGSSSAMRPKWPAS